LQQAGKRRLSLLDAHFERHQWFWQISDAQRDAKKLQHNKLKYSRSAFVCIMYFCMRLLFSQHLPQQENNLISGDATDGCLVQKLHPANQLIFD
jgi:hypothetical protein